MSERLARPNPLAEGFAELTKKRDLFLRDFRSFLPEIFAYTDLLMM
jgi:acyl carrier protein phosphodiesterase